MKVDSFKAWLEANGAEILKPTNDFEVIRFRANDQVSIVYKGKRGYTLTGAAEKAYKCFVTSKPWSGTNKNLGRNCVDVRTLIQRDGDTCFYCFKPMTQDEMTREHLLSRAQGGRNHISNQVLCHRSCNQEAGHLSVMEKIRIREKNLLERK
jgi:hypothetical protein